ncbi:amidohydrolase family protein [Leifsonia shinshuensis]|uniref:amidohydrolase family protein n=1 Tax=Leifsonia shinshuensis TaxID=150026 RepID=UPI001F5081D0|nr:amidohydrolase family protein [Leifsonia shinshuensis]
MTERIDAHVHLWNRATDPQDWIDPMTMAAIARDFGTHDLREMLRATGMDRAIVVQASNSLGESVRLAASDPAVVAGLVCWVDLTGDVAAQLATIGEGARVPIVGVRHLAHIDPDPEWLLRRDVGRGLKQLEAHGSTFDFVVRDWQLGQAARVAGEHPGLRFVLDHLGGPYAEGADRPVWEAGIHGLAAHPNTVAKLSGLSSGFRPGAWSAEAFEPVVATALEAFGPGRLLYGSDWPLAELGGGAALWREAVDALLAGLSDSEREDVLGGVAAEVYSLA